MLIYHYSLVSHLQKILQQNKNKQFKFIVQLVYTHLY